MDKEMTNAEVARQVIELVSGFQFDQLESYIHDDIVMEAPYQAFHNGPMRIHSSAAGSMR